MTVASIPSRSNFRLLIPSEDRRARLQRMAASRLSHPGLACCYDSNLMTTTKHSPSEKVEMAETKPPVAFPPEKQAAAIEAALLAVDKPLSATRLAAATGLPASGDVAPLIDSLNESYEASGRSFRIESVAGGYRILTLPDFATAVAAVRGMRDNQRLSRAALETLAIIAYRQPITRVKVESIRGVACGEVIRTLLDRRLVAIVGRAEELGRPMLYGTSKHFLESFGLASIKDLPKVSDLFPGLEPTPESPDAAPSGDGPDDQTDDNEDQ